MIHTMNWIGSKSISNYYTNIPIIKSIYLSHTPIKNPKCTIKPKDPRVGNCATRRVEITITIKKGEQSQHTPLCFSICTRRWWSTFFTWTWPQREEVGLFPLSVRSESRGSYIIRAPTLFEEDQRTLIEFLAAFETIRMFDSSTKNRICKSLNRIRYRSAPVFATRECFISAKADEVFSSPAR